MTDLDDFDLHRSLLAALAEKVDALQEEIALLRLNMEFTRARRETAKRIFDNAQEHE